MSRMSEQSFNELILTEIRAELGRQKMSHRELGRRLHWSSTTVHRRLIGRTPLSIDQFHQITQTLKVSPESLGFPLVTTSGKGIRS
jgi:transcriptional regulator with XRE-family HTH domain